MVESVNRNTRFKCLNKVREMQHFTFWFIIVGSIIIILSVSIVLSQDSSQTNGKHKIKLVVDVDAGVDDAIAILYLLRLEKYLHEQNKDVLDILGITCTRGNTLVDNVIVNVLKTLKVANRLDIPVYKGASQAILTSPPINYYFGQDGFGDVLDPAPPSSSLISSEHAVVALLRLVNENPGEITILSLGPLTNIALAIRMDENFLKKIKRIIILGGCVEGQGNILPGVEYNFYSDPEAVHIVLNSTVVDPGVIVLFPWEAVLKSPVSWKWRKEEMGTLESVEVLFLNEIEHIDIHTDNEPWLMADPMAAMLVLNTDIISKKGNYGIATTTSGPSKGSIAVDYENFLNSSNKIEIVFQVDMETVKSTLLKYFS